MRQARDPPPVRPLDDDLVTVEFLARLRASAIQHLSWVIESPVGREELERAAEAVCRVVQLRRPSPDLNRGLVVVRDQPFRVADIGRRR
jgi:hypothetical protein